jgi:hypothetical protein
MSHPLSGITCFPVSNKIMKKIKTGIRITVKEINSEERKMKVNT